MSQGPAHTDGGVVVTDLIVEVFRLNGRLLAAGDRLVGPVGLSSARWQVLGAVAMSPTPEPVARLARSMGVHRQGVQRIVDAMEAEGWFRFADNPHHRRAKLVELTPAGAELYEKASRRQRPWANALSADIDVAALKVTVEMLSALRSRIEAADDAPGSKDAPDETSAQITRSRTKAGERGGT